MEPAGGPWQSNIGHSNRQLEFLSRILSDRLQNPGATVFQKRDDMLETKLPSVVGIRNAQVAVMPAIPHKGPDLAMKSSAWIEATDIGEVRFVHGHNEVERGEILVRDLPGLTGDGKAMVGESLGHPRIRRRTLMIANGPSGIDLEFVEPTGIFGELPENDLRSW
jgi:hypothetical protein